MSPSLWKERPRKRAALVPVAIAGALLALGLMVPVVSLRSLATTREYSVLSGILDLVRDGNILLGAIVLAFSVVFPVAKLLALCATFFGDYRREERRRLVRRLTLLGKWSMLDVFVIVILLGAVRLGLISGAEPLPGLYLFGAAILCSMIAAVIVTEVVGEERAPLADLRHPTRLDRAVSSLALILFAAGLAAPLMTVEKWWFWERDYSLLGAHAELVREGHAFLAAFLGAFVVLLPGARIAGLCLLRWRPGLPARWVRRLRRLDEWAMLDVYALALLVVVVKIGASLAVTPRAGMWLLASASVLSVWDSWRLQRHVVRPANDGS
jgi:paraquat-inducible protein A